MVLIKTNQQFKNAVLDNKQYLRGKKVKVGKKTFIFDGAGDTHLLFRYNVSGLSTDGFTMTKGWVTYKKINPVIKKWMIKEIENLNGFNEVL